MRRLSVLALLAAVTLAAAACGSSSNSTAATDDQPAATSSTSTTSGSAAGALELAVTSSDLGDIVADADGRTLYLFTVDPGTTTACTGACASAWPALVGAVTAGPGITGTLTEVEQSDGTRQVALNGHLLYYYASDTSPGDTSGQGIGGKWFVVDGAGNAVTGSAGASRSGY
jgi:predicted lipoprotein with Yx(FWY)xxD motif